MTIDEINAQILALGELDGVDVFRVGYSLLGKTILGVHIGNYCGNQIISTGGIHGREYIGTFLNIELVKYMVNKQFDGGFYFVPLVNPDGVDIALNGVQNIKCEKLRQILTLVNDGSDDFSLWKADANAVDLNVNFDALWGNGVQNVFCPAPANFVGYYPNSEREVRFLEEFTTRNMPKMTVDFHTKGEVIYYGFETQSDEAKAINLTIANNIAEFNGYEVTRSDGSVAGYQDWSIDKLNIPSVTIEVGNQSMGDVITLDNLNEIFERNKDDLLIALNSINNIYKVDRCRGQRIWKGLCMRH